MLRPVASLFQQNSHHLLSRNVMRVPSFNYRSKATSYPPSLILKNAYPHEQPCTRPGRSHPRLISKHTKTPSQGLSVRPANFHTTPMQVIMYTFISSSSYPAARPPQMQAVESTCPPPCRRHRWHLFRAELRKPSARPRPRNEVRDGRCWVMGLHS